MRDASVTADRHFPYPGSALFRYFCRRFCRRHKSGARAPTGALLRRRLGLRARLLHVLRQRRELRQIGQQDDLDAAILAATFGRGVLGDGVVLAITGRDDVLGFIFASTRKRVTTSARAIDSSQLSLYVSLTG